MASKTSDASANEDRGHLLLEYPNFVHKILQQLEAVSESIAEVKAHLDHPNNWKNCDFICFEIRKACEYLTVAIVLAHYSDSGAIDDLRKWRPKELLAQVAKLSEHPTPVQISREFAECLDGSRHIKPLFRPVRATEISAIYGRCSDVLHVGSLERILDNKLPPYDISKLERWNDGLRALVENHALLLPGIKRVLIFSNRQFFVLEADGEGILDTSGLQELELLA